jgi:hypothetical protein
MIATGAIDREFIDDGLMLASIPEAQYRRILDEVTAKTDGDFTSEMVISACKKWEWVATNATREARKLRREQRERLLNGSEGRE